MDNDGSFSWAKMESDIKDVMSIYPGDVTSRQVFTLRYLTALAEYEEVNM